MRHICDICKIEFSSGPQLGGHKNSHKKTFEEYKSDGTRKSWLIRERGHQCEICKFTHWRDQPVPLELDHIDGYPENSVKENLRLVCPNCHAQTPTYKGKNKGRGRSPKRDLALKRLHENRKFKTHSPVA